MAYVYRGTNGDDYVVQNSRTEVEIYTYGGDDEIVLNRTDSRGGLNYVEAGSGNDLVRNSFEGGNDIFLGSGNDVYKHSGAARARTFDRGQRAGTASSARLRVQGRRALCAGARAPSQRPKGRGG